MNEHIHNPENKPDLNFDIADLGEPSFETMTAFFNELESVKRAGERKVIELSAGSDPEKPLPSGRLERTSLRPIEDPAYSGPRLNITILDGPPDLLEATKDQGFGPVVEIIYTDSQKTINYSLPFGGEPTLHIENLEPISPDDTATLDSLQDDFFGTELTDEKNARQLGVDKVTQGNMKILLKSMEEARLAREKYLASQV